MLSLTPSNVSIVAGNDAAIQCYGTTDVTFLVNDTRFTQQFYVCGGASVRILGMDFLADNAAQLNIRNRTATLNGMLIHLNRLPQFM